MTLDRINEEIIKTESKIDDLQTRLRDLRRQKMAAENSIIVEIIRDAEIKPEELAAFAKIYRQQQDNKPPISDEPEKEGRNIENTSN